MPRNNYSGFLISISTMIVAVTALLVILTLFQNANAAVRNEQRLIQIEEYSLHLNAGEWHTIADPAYLNQGRVDIAAADSRIETLLDELKRDEEIAAITAPVENSYLSYRSAINREFDLLAAGNVEAALDLDESEVDPGYERLEVAVQEAAGQIRQLADRNERLAYIGSTVAVISSALLISFFFWRFDKVRQMNVMMETERKILKKMSLVDDLTNIYNRRGFMALAEQQLKIATREGKRPIILFTDLDDMKWINDTQGHATGDRALISAARTLSHTFRESDIIARIGGDEFAVFALETPGSDADSLLFRLNRNLEIFNEDSGLPFRLHLSIGVAQYDPEGPQTIGQLLTVADRRMYEQKQKRKQSAMR